jgi:single-strand DNA-binding protein
MNQVNVIGRLGADIELRYTPSGKAVCELNLAVDDGWGENKKTVWLGVTVWGATAELAAKALTKGHRVGITGRLSQEEWEDKNTGKKQRKTKVTCQDMHLLEPKRDGQAPQQPTQHEAAKVNAYQPQAMQADDDNEDIPF